MIKTRSIKAVNIVRIVTSWNWRALAKRAIKKPPKAICEEILYYPARIVNLNHVPAASSANKDHLQHAQAIHVSGEGRYQALPHSRGSPLIFSIA